MTHYHHHYRRRPGPIAGLFWLMIAICALVAIAEINPPITAPFAFLLLVVTSSSVAELHGRATANRLVLIGFVPLLVSLFLSLVVLAPCLETARACRPPLVDRLAGPRTA